ncbi:hypothetical protein H4R18_003283 [Coemansia javaensis]|uniref:Adipose-regulatory protein-domain-containing protein n=1 Tax=Coemansia javaensis TaxID=2761396 RepID=A0A9W8H995_9FUNG|nr:hypothetical protein H4R18_003283 [Coemansia javaensis]
MTLLARPWRRLAALLPSRGAVGGGSAWLAVAVRALLASAAVGVVALTTLALYVLFYRLYVPQLLHHAPVYLQYPASPSANTTAVVNFVSAGDYKFLSTSQAYSVSLDLDVPTSEANQQIGNFMVGLELYNRWGAVAYQSARPSIVPYRSRAVRLLSTAARAVPLVLGLTREAVRLHIPLIEVMYDHHFSPIASARITLSRPLQVYAAHIDIRAQFSGLRYWMYYWRLPTTVVFVSAAVVWQLLVAAVVWAALETYAARPAAPHHRTPRIVAAPPSDASADESQDAASASGSVASDRGLLRLLPQQEQQKQKQHRHFSSASALGSPIARALGLLDPQPQPPQSLPSVPDSSDAHEAPPEQRVPASPGSGPGSDDDVGSDGEDSGDTSSVVPTSSPARALSGRPSSQSLRRRPTGQTTAAATQPRE